MWNFEDPLTSLLKYYLTLAIRSGRFASYVIQRNDTTNDRIFYISDGMQGVYSKMLVVARLSIPLYTDWSLAASVAEPAQFV